MKSPLHYVVSHCTIKIVTKTQVQLQIFLTELHHHLKISIRWRIIAIRIWFIKKKIIFAFQGPEPCLKLKELKSWPTKISKWLRHQIQTLLPTIQKKEVFVWWNYCLEKLFKIRDILGIRKPKYVVSSSFFFFFIFQIEKIWMNYKCITQIEIVWKKYPDN